MLATNRWMTGLTLIVLSVAWSGGVNAESRRNSPELATLTIVGADAESGELGIATASSIPAVGTVVPHGKAGVVVVATQSFANTSWGPRLIGLVGSGAKPREALRVLIDSDPDASRRQVALVTLDGISASFTGRDCREWSGEASGPDFVVVGAWLNGPEVVEAMASAYKRENGALAGRLLAALQAGVDAGGESRGERSAALLVVRDGGGFEGGDDRLVDIRIDHHARPIDELHRIYRLHSIGPIRRARERLAQALIQSGRPDAGFRELSRVEEALAHWSDMRPSDAEAKLGLAEFYWAQGTKLEDARTLVLQATKLAPNLAKVWGLLGRIDLALLRLLDARDAVRQAIRLDPTSTEWSELSSEIERAAESSFSK